MVVEWGGALLEWLLICIGRSRRAPMVADSIRVRLDVPQVRMVGVLKETTRKLEIAVESEASVGRCPGCGELCRPCA